MPDRHARPAAPTARDLMREIEVLVPLGMSVRAAGDLLDALGGGVAPVVDSRGRCVGLFTAADYQRWFDRIGSDASIVTGPVFANEVRYHISGRFAAATPDTGVQELLDRLQATGDQYLVILDRQARPRGIVCAFDVLVAVSHRTRVEGELAMAN